MKNYNWKLTLKQKEIYTITVKRLYFSVIHVSTDNHAGPGGAVGSASDSRARGPGFDTQSGHILSFLLPLKESRCQLQGKVCGRSTS